MAQKKFNPEDIDEDFLISTIQNDKPVIAQKTEKTTTKPKVKKNIITNDYESNFLRQAEGKARFGKNVPIRQEHHEKILKIVRIIGNDELSIFNYIDNVLSRHFDEYREEITKLYNEKNEDIF